MILRKALGILSLSVLTIVLATAFAAAEYAPLPSPPANADLDDYRQTAALYREHLESQPNDFEANWKLSRLLNEYGKQVKKKKPEGWKEICERVGKEGMRRAEKAAGLRPDRPEGFYYLGLNAGVYANGAGVMDALTEGLRTKTLEAFEKAHQLDPLYNEGGPILALANYWASVPWPFKNREKAMKYCREYQATEFYRENPEARVRAARVLIKIDTEAARVEARALLVGLINKAGPRLAKKAQRTLSKIR